MSDSRIAGVCARRIWDSRGRPTVEVEITTAGGSSARGIAPAGASRGDYEATDLRDGGSVLGGFGVSRALGNIREMIAPALLGVDVTDQNEVDRRLDDLDPSETRSVLGGNATVAASLAALQASAVTSGRPVWACLNPAPLYLPRPEVQIFGGGAHAANAIDVQDLMIVPLAARNVDEALQIVAEVYARVGERLTGEALRCGVADEGGYWPCVRQIEDAIEQVLECIESAGLSPGRDVALSLDVAASEFELHGGYHLRSANVDYTRSDWIEVVAQWMDRYPIVAIEDPVGQRDAAGMIEVTRRFGANRLVIGDDFVVTNARRIRSAARAGACNAALIKVNQAGTVTAAATSVMEAKRAGWSTIVSARSGETEDVSVSHLAVGWQANLVKVGSIARGERTAKWNELLRIDAALGGDIRLAPLRYEAKPLAGESHAGGSSGASLC